MGGARQAGTPAIGRHVIFLRRNAQAPPVDAAKAAKFALVRQAPLHALIGEVGEGMAERRKLPIEHGQKLRARGVENHVVDAPIAMHQRDAAVVGGNIGAKPGDQRVHVRIGRRRAGSVLLAPARELPGEVIARLAEVAEIGLCDVDGVQTRQRRVHRVVDRGAKFRRLARQRRVPKNPPLDERHKVKGRADDALVFA